MATARVFKSGNSQAVRLPKDFRFRSKEVDIFRRGEEVILREKSKGMERAFWLIANLPIDADAVKEVHDEPPQERDGL
jgi:antitoxin VapB